MKKMMLAGLITTALVAVALFQFLKNDLESPTYDDLPEVTEEESADPVFEYGALPPNIEWTTDDTSPEYTDSKAKRGGVYRTYISSFPVTLRTVGPDSNGTFRSFINVLMDGLIGYNSETKTIIPSLATHWYFAPDHKTIYFKLNPKVTWSDGVPVTAKDYAYTLEFMRSKWIYAPWYNDYYTNTIHKVIIVDDYTIAIVGKEEKSNFENSLTLAISPTPEHYYRPILNKDWIKKYNWEWPPTTGAYVLGSIKKGKSITLKRISHWWGDDQRHFRYTSNFDEVRIEVIRDDNMAFDYFLKGKLDTFSVTQVPFWNKTNGPSFDNGYINKVWFYNEMPRPSFGFWLNSEKWPFDNLDVRIAFAYALNYENVIKNVTNDEQVRLNRYHQGTGDYDNTAVKARPYDIQKVEEHMLRANWKRNNESGLWQDEYGNDFSVEVLYGQDILTGHMTVLREDARKAGIDMKLRLMDQATSFKTASEKQFEATFFGLSTTSILPSYWQTWHSDNAKVQTNNFTMVKDSQLDKWIDEWRVEFDDNKKHELSKNVQQRIHDLALFIPGTISPFFRGIYWPWFKFPKKIMRGTYSILDMYPIAWFDQETYDQVNEARKKDRPYQEPVLLMDTTYK
jgi:microcin C transport system substrate-binding protein